MLSGVDAAVLALVGAGAALAVRSIRRTRKKGGRAGCSGSCRGCGRRDAGTVKTEGRRMDL